MFIVLIGDRSGFVDQKPFLYSLLFSLFVKKGWKLSIINDMKTSNSHIIFSAKKKFLEYYGKSGKHLVTS